MSHSALTSDIHASGDSPVKRMRLGTKSCAECRRRKVRCVFPPGADTCEGCSLHNVGCQPQTGAQSNRQAGSILLGGDTDSTGQDALHRRIAHLEGMMSRILDSQSSNQEVSLDSSTRTPSTEGYNDFEESLNGEGDAQFENAPLPTLWKDAMVVRPTPNTPPKASVKRIKPSIHITRPPLPTSVALEMLLEDSEKFWPTWPLCTFGVTGSQQLIAGQQLYNRDVLLESIESGDPLLISKAFLWLTLCLSQLKRGRIQALSLPKPRRELMEQYHSYVMTILGSVGDVGESPSGIECYALQWKIYFDCGKPRKAWQILRQAITSAIQLGWHRMNTYKDDRKEDMWTSFWQAERQISCTLGLPSCTSNEHPGTQLGDLSSTDPIEIVHYKLSIIAGEIIKRDQTPLKSNYAAAVQIDHNLEETRAILPLDFWNPPRMDQPFAVTYNLLATKMQFWTVQKLIHLPYMLKSLKDSKYLHSFTRAIDAARNIIDTLRSFRRICDDFMCEVMDFQAFSAAIVLMIGVLALRGTNAEEGKADFDLIKSAAKCLRQTAIMLECNVARQGADTLDALIEACNGTYSRREDLIVTIPYFGQVRLNYGSPARSSNALNITTFPSRNLSTLNTTGPQTTSMMHDYSSSLHDNLDQEHLQPLSPTTIEFSGNEFNQMSSMDFSFDEELALNWFAVDRSGATDFTWTQEFHSIS